MNGFGGLGDFPASRGYTYGGVDYNLGEAEGNGDLGNDSAKPRRTAVSVVTSAQPRERKQ